MIFFSSDLHFYHSNVIRYCNRPYSSVEEMNELLIYNWNCVVRPSDQIYILGDFSLAIRPVELYTERLLGKKYLVPGNHDFCHSYHKRSRKIENRQKWIRKYEDCGWTVLPEQTTLNIEGLANFNLCHFPYTDGEITYKDKYENWRPKKDGRWLLHGHTHSKQQNNLDKRMIDVGVDCNNYTPISVDQIKLLMG